MISPVLYSSRSEEWGTPQHIFDALNDEFHFTLDPCASRENAKCSKFYTVKDDGLTKDWSREVVFVNPPYGKNIGKWMKKCWEESQKGTTIVCLVHARTDTKWFWDWVHNKAEIRFVKGRLRFEGSKYSSPFPSIVVVYRGGVSND